MFGSTGVWAQTAADINGPSSKGPNQPPATGAATQPSNTISEIIVTSRRRAERLQDVPLAITALSAQTLEQAHVTKLSDAAALTAGLLLPKNSSETGGSGVIRGIVDLSGTGTPTVSTYFNGVYLGNPTAVSIGMMDVKQIEIVKGPVSALYGRGGFSGAINYSLAGPGDTFAGHITGDIGNGGEHAVYGQVSGPVIPGVLRLGFAGNYDNFDGIYKDHVDGLREGGHEKKDIRGSFDYTPFNHLHIYGGYYYGDDFFNAPPSVHTVNNCGTYTSATPTPGSRFSYTCGEIKAQPIEVANIGPSSNQAGNQRKVQIGDFHANYDLGWADANFIGGYTRVTQVTYEDFTTFRNGIPFALTNGTTRNLFELFGSNNDSESQTYEVRLSSKQHQQLRWAIGGYYSKEQTAASTLIGLDGSKLPAGVNLANPVAQLFLTPTGSFSTSNYTFVEGTDELYSPFASLEYDIIPNLTFTGELRYNHQDKSQDILHNAFVTNTLRPYGAAGTTTASFNYTNYRISLRYKILPSLNVYVSEATGEKAGGFNTRATIVSEIAYAPETNKTYEAGVKADLLNRRLQVNAAGFYIQDKGLQVLAPSNDPNNIGLVTKNFGSSTDTGFEVEGLGILSEHVSLSGAVAYVDPSFNKDAYDFSPAICSTIPSCAGRVQVVSSASGNRAAVSLNGLQAPGTSKWLINGGLNLKGHVTSTIDWYGRVDYRFESKRYTTVDDINYVGSRSYVDLSAGLHRGPVSLEAYCENCNNDTTPILANPNTRLNDFGVTWVAQLPDPRMYGVRVRFDF